MASVQPSPAVQHPGAVMPTSLPKQELEEAYRVRCAFARSDALHSHILNPSGFDLLLSRVMSSPSSLTHVTEVQADERVGRLTNRF